MLCSQNNRLILYVRVRVYSRFVPKFFEKDITTGAPALTAEGRKAIEEELQEEAEHKLEIVSSKEAA